MDSYNQFTPSDEPYRYPDTSAGAPFRLDEGFSEDTSWGQEENDGRNMNAATAARFQEWVMAQDEDGRAEIAYEVLRTLRTSTIATVMERFTPLLHMDPVVKLPAEIAVQIFSYLDADGLLTASLASRMWRARAVDTMLWQALYRQQGWGLEYNELRAFESMQRRPLLRAEFRNPRPSRASAGPGSRGQPQLKKRVTSDWLQSRGRRLSADVSQWREQHGAIEADTDMMQCETPDQEMHDAPLDNVPDSPPRPTHKRQSRDSGEDLGYSSSHVTREHRREGGGLSYDDPSAPSSRPSSNLTIRGPNGEQRLNWLFLYKQRQKLEQNWTKGRFTTFQLPHPSYPEEGHTECVYTIQFFGKWLVSGSRDRSLRVWDLETRRLRDYPLTGHSQSVLCLQFDPTEEEDVIISGSSDASVIIWRFSTGAKLHEIRQAHEESVLNLRFDRRYLVTCSKDRRIKIWNRHHLTAMHPDYPKVSDESSAQVPSYIVNTDDMEPSLLEARLANGTIRELKPYMLLLTLEGHGAAINAIQISGDLIVSASGDRLIKVWSARDGRLVRTLQGHQKGIACVQFDSKRIVSGSSDNTIRIYDPVTGAEVAELKGHTNLVRTIQAGFADLPGSDEDDKLKAKEAERKYLQGFPDGLGGEARNIRPSHGGDGDDRGGGSRRGLRASDEHQGSSRLALGSRLPPGGGGSKWGRIISGSYDQTIIIWRKNAEGDWVIGQTLKHERALQQSGNAGVQRPTNNNAPHPPTWAPAHPLATPSTGGAAHAPRLSAPASAGGPAGAAHPVVMSASQIMQQAVETSLVNLGAGISNVMGIGRVLNGPAGGLSTGAGSSSNPTSAAAAAAAAAATAGPDNVGAQGRTLRDGSIKHHVWSQQRPQQSRPEAAGQRRAASNHAQSQDQGQDQSQGPSHDQSHSQSQGQSQSQQQPHLAAPGASVPVAALHHPHAGTGNGGARLRAPQPAAGALQQQQQEGSASAVSRVFKLQFDARRIVCCSQDSRIVGWDFANGDAEVMEAARFFAGP
jgi:F-box and WD-40 domain protein 1/11